MKNIFKKYFGIWVAVLFWLAIVATNFSPNTFLSGWDNLHPEFNFSVNLKRALFASWQEYQGLGLLGGMGHASDLFRQILLWISSFVLPVNFIRYFFHFSMLLAGSLGIYFLLKDSILEKSGESPKKWGSLGGAVFYLFNLGMLQMFYVPFEVFSVHFGFLPWLFWGVFKYLKDTSKKNLLIFLLINILAVSQGYVATVFIVYLMALSLFLIAYFLFYRQHLKRIFLILIFTFLINAFWLLPNLYFVFNDVWTNTGAKINLMSTENNLLLNKKYGDFKDVLLLRGFWFENTELQASGITEYIMGEWVNYLNKPLVTEVGYVLFGLSILGMILAIVTKNKKAVLFMPVFLLGFTFLANDAPIFSFLARLLYKLPLFSQIFRFPFTKFSILTAFCLAIYFGILIAEITRMNFKKVEIFGYILIFLPAVFMCPVFQGKLFYIKEKAKIPSEYFEVFNFFKNQDQDTRIANFPQTIFWGWTNYKWGEQLYSGSGFIWYGIQQPILDRAFDVWSKQNENYYWEISQALYSKNQELFEKIFDKYQINWLLFDGNVINTNEYRALGVELLEDILSNSEKFSLVAVFGKIKIYKVNLDSSYNSFVALAENLPQIEPSYEWNNFDQAYQEYGNYFSENLKNLSRAIYYPFRSVFTGRKTEELTFDIEEREGEFVFRQKISSDFRGHDLVLPSEYEGKELVYVNPDNLGQIQYFLPRASLKEDVVEVVFPKINGYFSANLNSNKDSRFLVEARNCNFFSKGKVENKKEGEYLRLLSLDANNCSAAYPLINFPHNLSYLIKVNAKNVKGKSLLFWLENINLRRADQELYLPKNKEVSYIIQPPMTEDGLGYTLHFDNISIGRKETINDLGEVSVYLLPYRFLTQLALVPKTEQVLPPLIRSDLKVDHPNPSLYIVNLENLIDESKDQTLILSQSFHSGWRAYEVGGISDELKTMDKIKATFAPLFGKEIKDHILVNNWENGWKIDSSVNNSKFIVLIFWPQYLEYLGFIFLLLTFLVLIF